LAKALGAGWQMGLSRDRLTKQIDEPSRLRREWFQRKNPMVD